MSRNERPENKDGKQKPGVSRRDFIKRSAYGAGAVALTSAMIDCGGSSASAAQQTNAAEALTSSVWKFGVMADTQWTATPDDGYNPNTSAVGISAQLQQQFINQGVKLVVHVGDLCDQDALKSTNSPSPANPPANSNAVAGEYTRALYAQALYNAGIGFFPHRGNHDDNVSSSNPLAAQTFQLLYPQTQSGLHNSINLVTGGAVGTPANQITNFATTDGVVPLDFGSNPYPTPTGSPYTVGSNFSSPNPWNDGGLDGLSYSFDFGNARFVLLDQFGPTTGNALYQMEATIGGSPAYPSAGSGQQPWITRVLQQRASGSHAFVFSHKGLITCNHADNLFSPASGANANPYYNTPAQNAFFSSLASNNVGYYMCGHDHMYDRTLITSPDGKSTVRHILTSSNSSKFYLPQGSGTNTSTVPLGQTNDTYWASLNNVAPRRQVMTQELYTLGYYIYTVNGPLVTVDYWAAVCSPTLIDSSEAIVTTAEGLSFTKRETFGYGLNGQQFVVAQGQPYSVVQDKSPNGTTMAILGGINKATNTDACGQACVKSVNTGWLNAAGGAQSDILSLWGVNTWLVGSNPDIYTLSMGAGSLLSRNSAICAMDSNGNWTNAVNLNSGGTKNFVSGPWNASYGLGTYGVDPTTKTAWAVLNYNAMFAIAIAS